MCAATAVQLTDAAGKCEYTNNRQQADTGTKMIHIGKNTKSTIMNGHVIGGRKTAVRTNSRAFTYIIHADRVLPTH